MPAIRQLLLAIEVATRQRDDASQNTSRAQHAWARGHEQMEQLESYATQTESRWGVANQSVASAETVRNYYQFMERLRQAIVLQREALDALQAELEASRQLLLQAEVRMAALERLLEKKRSDAQRLLTAQEQKQLDEFASMQHRRRTDTMGTS